MHLIMTNMLTYYNLSLNNDGDAVITAPSSIRSRYTELFNRNYIDAEFGKDFGIGEVILRYKKRYGIFIGLFLMLLIVYASSLFVWNMDQCHDREEVRRPLQLEIRRYQPLEGG